MTDRSRVRGFRAAAAALVVIAAVLRFWALDTGLPHPMSRPDEETVLAQTEPLARGQWDPRYAIYPHAYLYVTWAWGAAGLAAGRTLSLFPPGDYREALRAYPERLLLVDRVLSALAGTATVALLVAIVRPALGDAAALAGATLLATSFLHARDSHAVKPDVLMTLGIVAVLGLLAPLARRATLARGALVGAAIGLSTGIKYPALLLLAPTYVAAVMGSSRSGWRRLFPASAVLAGVTAGLVFVATSPYLVLNPDTRASVFSVLGSIFPQALPRAYSIPPGLAELTEGRHWWDGYLYHARFSLRYGAGLLQTLLAPVAVVWGLRSGYPLPCLTALFTLIYYAVNGLSPMMLARYMTPLVPALAILEAGLLVALAARTRARWRPVLVGLGAAVLVAESLASTIGHNRIAAETDTRVLATEWFRSHVPAGSRVGIVGTHFWGYGEPVMPAGVEMVRENHDLDRLRAAGVVHVLAHDHPLFFSHVDPAVADALTRRAQLLAEFDPFTPEHARAIFEEFDAYYVPMHGFEGVRRPGPHITIHRLE